MGETKARTIAEKRASDIEKAEKLLDAMYYRIFEGNADGQKLLQDLQHKFYDRTSVVGSPVDTGATLVREGERNVMLYIMTRLSSFQANKE